MQNHYSFVVFKQPIKRLFDSIISTMTQFFLKNPIEQFDYYRAFYITGEVVLKPNLLKN